MRRLSFFLTLLCALPCFAQTNNARMLSGVNVVTLTSYPFVPLDATRLVTFVNSNPVNAVLPPGNVLGFGAGVEFDVLNIGPATSTIVCTCLIYSGTAPNGASSLPLSAGQGVQLFGAGLNYYALIEGSSILGLLGSNNVWTGSNTFNGALVVTALNGTTVLGTQGGGGGVGYILFGTGSFTQNTLARFDATGSLVNSFWTDSSAIGAYTGVNGIFSPSYNTNGSGAGFVGISQGTLPGSYNGGVNTFYADTNTGMMVIGTHVGSTDITNWIPVAGPYFDALGLSANINPNPTVMQNAAGAATEWRFHVNVNQVSAASCTNAAAGSVVVKLAYTDSAGLETPTIATLTFLTSFTGANSASGDYALRVNSTNNISIQTTYTPCTTGTGSYDIHAWLERVK